VFPACSLESKNCPNRPELNSITLTTQNGAKAL
jgi:hypothetical protein